MRVGSGGGNCGKTALGRADDGTGGHSRSGHGRGGPRRRDPPRRGLGRRRRRLDAGAVEGRGPESGSGPRLRLRRGVGGQPTRSTCSTCAPRTPCTRPLVRAALSAGKHVVCEKPLSLTGADCDALVELAANSGLVNAVPLVYRYHPMTVEARERVRREELGPIRLIHGHYLQDWLARPEDNNWRVDPAVGGASRAFADIGSHWCDLLEWITGHRISELTAATQTVLPQRSAAGRETFTGSGAESAAETAQTASQIDRHHRGRRPGPVPHRPRRDRRPGRLPGLPGPQEPALVRDRRRRAQPVLRRRGPREPAARRPGPHRDPAPRRRCREQATPDQRGARRPPVGLPRLLRGLHRRRLRGDRDPEAAAKTAPLFPTFADAARTAHITDAVLTSAAHRSWIEVS